ncbi:Hypothetical_protein [Hexamita inflata]|uniref:Hypothetical_protein n=1 Tax=Hexamita inflata TaxID=28002 RepID=A0AA86P0G9_9EUKA|nr:Hypothetical protein HINF_LOCUS16355 [Hexamita inflata]CAI9933872.1 Hypothetical protein HINF_LOCUS21517 [Hexamita inflata]
MKADEIKFYLVMTLASPVLLIGGIFYLIFIFPVQQIIKSRIQKQKKRSQAYSVTMHIKNDIRVFAEQYLIQVEKLMFVFKPVHYLDLYIGVLNSHLYVFNKQLVCLKVCRINYNFEQWLQDEFYSSIFFSNLYKPNVHNRKVTLNDTFQTNVIAFQGKHYFTVFDFLFCYDGFTVSHVAQIPRYQYFFRCRKSQIPKHIGEPRKHLDIMDFPSGTMFTINNKLYVHNHSKQLYELRRNKFKCVNRDHMFKSYYQFCDKVYCVDFNHLYVVQNNLKLKVLSEFSEPRILVNHCGILIITCHLNYQFRVEYLALNMLDGVVTQISDMTTYFEKNMFLTDNLELGNAGLQLSEEMTAEVYGPKYSSRVQQYNCDYQSKTGQYQVKNILDVANIDSQQQFSRIIDRFQSLQHRILNQCDALNNNVQTLAHHLSCAVNVFKQIEETDQ